MENVMWYVESRINESYERWEGLTKEQAIYVHNRYRLSGVGATNLGPM